MYSLLVFDSNQGLSIASSVINFPVNNRKIVTVKSTISHYVFLYENDFTMNALLNSLYLHTQ